MSSFEPSIYCVNPACSEPRNPLGGQVCASCNTPLVYRHLWAVGPEGLEFETDTVIAERYTVVAPQIWLDTQPSNHPYFPQDLPEGIFAYLFLYPYRLHIPEIYGFAPLGETPYSGEVMLLENVPVDPVGNLYPSLSEVWPTSSAVRQVYWLWQMLELWQPFLEQGVAGSLIVPENIRVEGWRIWLLELYSDDAKDEQKSVSQRTLEDLGQCWMNWIPFAHPTVISPLKEICNQLQAKKADFTEISWQLNRLLLECSAQLPLRLRVAGATDTGTVRDHNEDTCYPTEAELKQRTKDPHNRLIPYWAVVCDGVGGHEGGEVASQSAVQSLKPLILSLLNEAAEATEPTPPALLAQQIEESIRVINNTIAAQNDNQGRSSRQRMGTTLVMALQLPQRVRTDTGVEYGNAHELYLAHVGDSRAYWITSEYCQRLTVDDDVAAREVRLGRCLYREALKRGDAGALTQALGTRDGEFLRPNVQRFILEDDGLLLLCSDGLSDNDLVELFWADYAPAVLKGEMPLEAAVQWLIDLANERNGHDNTSVVMVQCRLSPEPLTLFEPGSQVPTQEDSLESEFSEASRALLDAEATTAEPVPVAPPTPRKEKMGVLGVLAVLVISSLAGLFTWSQLNPGGLERLRESVFPSQSK
ncbi:protein phosphatase 2C domain-containing protein [Ancylothrix sp. C2]|uniref:protein phosphatase 2C domain-containing protein n=1 Tax=Ancylothrix sp. D3o TaxID=2953691 RepID=UPI0021BA9831|nr:protein phosphatase 2C domain-containing protein [Ancylothrix sp. D3o]MCT7948887.1 protein phosphatase 2C domain-containing protein [Ancylothrix sp. D3o]